MSENPAPSVDDRPTREQIARSITDRIDWTPTVLAGSDPRVSVVEQVLRLAEYETRTEVRTLRAELERHEVQCPSCSATIRARMADVPSGEEVPAQLHAAAKALEDLELPNGESGTIGVHAARNLRRAAEWLTDPTPEPLRAAVAAALDRPTAGAE